MSTVIFDMEGEQPIRAEAKDGENLLELARRCGAAVDAPCSGSGTCGKCRVRVLKGELESSPSRHITPEEWDEGWRLSCASRVRGDVTVLVPGAASAFRSKLKITDFADRREAEVFRQLRQELTAAGLPFENSLRRLELMMEPPTLEDTLPDSERLSRAIQEKTAVREVEIPCRVMEKLARVLRENNFRVCVLGRLEGEKFCCMELRAPGKVRMAGCAVDIGTTTVTAALMDLEDGRILARSAAGNAQIAYGADVISRIIQQGKPGGREKLRRAIIDETLNPILKSLCQSAGVDPACMLHMVIAANTTMNHLLVGADAQSIRTEPYIPSFFHWEGLTAADLGLHANPLAPVSLAPNIGSYVGGDITAGTLASQIWAGDEMSLMVDLGTNGEIVFGNRDFLISCACSAGPAFEGGGISCGMRASEGAIEACRLDNDTMEPMYRVIGGEACRPAGLCGSGIIDVVAELFCCGVIDARGHFVREGSRIRRDGNGMARYVLAEADRSGSGREISVTEVDIDSFIRTKGAVYSAIETLLRAVDLSETCIDRVFVAGGIGSGLHLENAVRIGMFPALEPEKFRYIGNSALLGAYAMTVSDEARRRCDELAQGMTYLELSTCPGYMDSFVAACFLPHTDAKRFSRYAPEN